MNNLLTTNYSSCSNFAPLGKIGYLFGNIYFLVTPVAFVHNEKLASGQWNFMNKLPDCQSENFLVLNGFTMATLIFAILRLCWLINSKRSQCPATHSSRIV